MKLGSTGDFPRGKFSQDDEGELRIAVGHKDKTVIIDFGTPTKWIGLDAAGARQLASLLQLHAADCESEK